MDRDDHDGISKTLQDFNPAAEPGLKERVWRRAIGRERPARRAGAIGWGSMIAVGAAAVLLLALWPGISTKDPINGFYRVSPDWRSGEAHAAEIPSVAQQRVPPGRSPMSRPPGETRRDKVDKIHRANLDIKALYWAWRIAFVKDVTYDELHAASRGWIMKRATRDTLFAGIKDLLDTGKARPLTKAERKRSRDVTNRVREVLGTGPLGTPADEWPILDELDRVDRRTLEQDALYWAWRIAGIKDVTYDDLHAMSERWIMRRSTRDMLFAGIKRILDTGTARELTPEERRIVEEGRAEARRILR